MPKTALEFVEEKIHEGACACPQKHTDVMVCALSFVCAYVDKN